MRDLGGFRLCIRTNASGVQSQDDEKIATAGVSALE
jgi:hypothetical protein